MPAAREDWPCPTGSFEARFRALRDANVSGESPDLTPQRRGYCLETLLRDAFESSGLDPRGSFRIDGEQIDGSFVLDGRPFLLEAKWWSDALPASAVYAFKGKVDGKLVGTVGLMVAIGGLSEDAVEALTHGKTLNVLLADGEDLAAAFGPAGSIRGMLDYKVRAAVDAGTVYAEYRPLAEPVAATKPAINIVVEGPSDKLVVEGLARKVLEAADPNAELVVHVGLGIENSLRLAGSLRDSLGYRVPLAVVVDADEGETKARNALLGAHPWISARQILVVSVESSVEGKWLGIKRGTDRRPAIEQALESTDVDDLKERSESFARLARFLEGKPQP